MAINFLDGITVDGNVGIGTTSPAEKLEVVGDIKVNDSVNPNIRFARGASYWWDIGHTSSDFQFKSATGGTIMHLNYDGNVGIGTTSPDRLLEVYGTTYGYMKIDGGSALSNGFTIGSDSSGFVIYDDDVASYRFVINQSGNVGIGNTSPAEKLDVAGNIKTTGQIQVTPTSGYGTIEIGGPSGGFIDLKGPSTDDYDLRIISGGSGGSFWTGGYGHVMTLNSSGNVGIGTTSPSQKLDVSGNINATGTMECTKFVANANSGFEFSIEGDNQFNMIQTAANRSMFFVTAAGSGSINFGTNNTNSRVSITSTGALKSTISLAVGAITPSTTVGRIDAANDVVAFSTSDIRLKDNIKNIDKALDKVNSIQGIEFDWIEKEEVHGNSGHDIGVIAQEIEEILPDVVTTRDSGYKAVKYEKIVPLLIEAIKDLSKQVDGLKRLI